MESVEVGNNLQTDARRWGVLTSLRNHVYGITQSQKKGEKNVLQKEKETTLMEYVKKIQLIRLPITLTQLQLKVVEIT